MLWIGSGRFDGRIGDGNRQRTCRVPDAGIVPSTQADGEVRQLAGGTRAASLTPLHGSRQPREGPCGELAPIAPAYHRPRSGGGAGTPFCPIRSAARPPRPPDCHVRGLTEVWVGSVLREGPCGELAPIAPAYHRPRSGGGAGTPFRPIRGAARPPRPPDCHVRGLTE